MMSTDAPVIRGAGVSGGYVPVSAIPSSLPDPLPSNCSVFVSNLTLPNNNNNHLVQPPIGIMPNNGSIFDALNNAFSGGLFLNANGG